ncbi:flavodoxin-dependent (E)-4-hydroxy-3-methylbut-2-enyl-diphosphate synthase [Candidatus Woesearchaeota archaeon]|nr:flavodoxin-dependent (E)-4-hydroxy-3-methylbut-2-enyl-diphosphate synthase [Candidatus Woesearchaeota archaeon]
MKPTRRKSIPVQVGAIGIGGDNPIRIQSMTNTSTADVEGTARQILELADAGSELVRITVQDNAYAEAVPRIKKKLEAEKCEVPLIGDFHFNGHLLLSRYPECAKALDKFRINPGNVGFGDSHDNNFKAFIELAILHDKPVRIGVNAGSLDQRTLTRLMDENSRLPLENRKTAQEIKVDAMVASALESARMAERYGMKNDKIILSAKVSKVPELIGAYEKLAGLCEYPLHVGLTEAGIGTKGIVSSTAGISHLLQKGIGDTIRVSLTPSPTSPRTEEVKVAQQILQANGIRSFMPTVTSCPGCGRTTSKVFQEIAEDITAFLEERTPFWKRKGFQGVEEMTVAVMGCIVNGPGESKEANIGLSLPGLGEDPVSPVFADGRQDSKLKGPERIENFKKMIEEYVEKKYGGQKDGEPTP